MFTAKLYNKTGFNLVNIPDSPELLETAATSTKEVPTMDILQLYFNTVITVRAFEIDVMTADYLELSGRLTDDHIHKAYYYINDYVMTSGDTVELSVAMEPWLTCGGISKVKFLDGITNRHHVGRTEDAFGQYQEEDDIFVPSEPVEIREVDRLFDPTNLPSYRDGSGYGLVVLSSTDLTLAKQFKYDVWVNSADESAGKKGTMGYGGTFAEWMGGDRFNPEQLLSTHRTFCGNPFVVTCGINDATINSIMSDVIDIFANGAGSVISYMYLLPLQYASIQSGVMEIMQNTVNWEEFEFKVGGPSYKNIRVFGGSENSEIFLSTASGAVKEIRIDHISASEEEGSSGEIICTSNVTAFADVRPGGGITYEFQEKTTPSSIMEGGKWMEMTSAVTSADGINQARAQFEANRTLSNMSYGAEALQGIDPGANKLIPYINKFHLIPHKYLTDVAKNAFSRFENESLNDRFGVTQNGRIAMDIMDLNSGDLLSGIKAGNEKAMSAYTRQLQLQNEMSQFNAGVVLNGHVMGDIKSVPDTSCHELIHYKKRLSGRDMIKFDKILTMYGYRHTTPINSVQHILTNREKFNFIQTKGVSIDTTANVPKSVRDSACDAFNTGVRIWHVKPDVSAYSNNPYHGV